jgi:hypothetical protein
MGNCISVHEHVPAVYTNTYTYTQAHRKYDTCAYENRNNAIVTSTATAPIATEQQKFPSRTHDNSVHFLHSLAMLFIFLYRF